MNTRRQPYQKTFLNPDPAEQAVCAHTFERQPYTTDHKMCVKCGFIIEPKNEFRGTG